MEGTGFVFARQNPARLRDSLEVPNLGFSRENYIIQTTGTPAKIRSANPTQGTRRIRDDVGTIWVSKGGKSRRDSSAGFKLNRSSVEEGEGEGGASSPTKIVLESNLAASVTGRHWFIDSLPSAPTYHRD